jgi:predicted alpha/beta-fold hydrolase
MSGIKRIRCPVLIVHGTDDSVVPYQVRDGDGTELFSSQQIRNYFTTLNTVRVGFVRSSQQSAAATGARAFFCIATGVSYATSFTPSPCLFAPFSAI